MTAGAQSAADRPEGPTRVGEPDIVVPDGERPAARCPYCNRPFRTERLCVLHTGETHAEVCTDGEQEVYDEAYDTESDELFVFHLKVTAALVLITFGLIYIYAFAWT